MKALKALDKRSITDRLYDDQRFTKDDIAVLGAIDFIRRELNCDNPSLAEISYVSRCSVNAVKKAVDRAKAYGCLTTEYHQPTKGEKKGKGQNHGYITYTFHTEGFVISMDYQAYQEQNPANPLKPKNRLIIT